MMSSQNLLVKPCEVDCEPRSFTTLEGYTKMERATFFAAVVIYLISTTYCVCKAMHRPTMPTVDAKDVRDVYVTDCNIKRVTVFGDAARLFIHPLKSSNDQGELCGKTCFVTMTKS